jgi:NDP-sugar pyrophosphorylase family protein
MYEAFILAAGFGTRLRPLTDDLPKPLVPVCGVPMLAYALAQCAHFGIEKVVVNAHWKAEALAGWAGLREGCHVSISEELPEILGTGGGLHRVQAQLAERFVVLNGDVLNDVDLDALRGAIPAGGGVLALRAHGQDAARYGVVAVDETDTLVHLRDIAEAKPQGVVVRDTHFTGIHAMERGMLELVEPGFSCIIRSAYKALVPERRIAGLRHTGVWLDIGDPTMYLEANIEVLTGNVRLYLDPRTRAERFVEGAQGALQGPVWLGEGARLGEGVALRRSIIGAHATVASGASLEDCVVWDRAEVPPGNHVRTIFYGGGAITV